MCGVELEREGEEALVLEAADELVLGLHAVLFCPDLVVGLRGELVEVEATVAIGEVALDGEAGGVFEVDDGVADGRLGCVDDLAVGDDVDRGFEVLGVRFGAGGAREQRRDRSENEGVAKDAFQSDGGWTCGSRRWGRAGYSSSSSSSARTSSSSSSS